MSATNHAGFSVYTYSTALGWVIGEVRATREEAFSDMQALQALNFGNYAVRESVWLNGVIV